MDEKGTPILGIIGGLGPLASAEFLKTIYEYNLSVLEQDMPRVVMFSDPSFPDRKQSFLTQNDEDLLHALSQSISQMHALHVDKIVICCVSLHYLLPRLTAALQQKVISLIDVIMSNLILSGHPHLLLSSTVPRKAGIFETHYLYPQVKELMVFPSDEDQELITHFINQYKTDTVKHPFIPVLEKMLLKYETPAFIAACSEIHILTKQLLRQGNGQEIFIDPLHFIATRLSSLI